MLPLYYQWKRCGEAREKSGKDGTAIGLAAQMTKDDWGKLKEAQLVVDGDGYWQLMPFDWRAKLMGLCVDERSVVHFSSLAVLPDSVARHCCYWLTFLAFARVQ